jgi:hypothetical protein
MMNLMAAIRKILQFAPKVGGPLAKLAGAREGWRFKNRKEGIRIFGVMERGVC